MLRKCLNYNHIKSVLSRYKRLIVIATLSCIISLLIVLLTFLQKTPEHEVNLNDYIINYDTNLEHEDKHLKDPYMLQLLNIYKTEQIIDMNDKPSIRDLFQDNKSWEEALNDEDFINYQYPLKLPSVIYSNDIKHAEDNCIIFVLTEAGSVKKAIKSLLSLIEDTSKMKSYPVYFITGFFLDNNSLLKIFNTFDPLEIDITIIKITDIIVDEKMCGESIDYLFQGFSDIKCNEYRENRNVRMNNDFENLYPLGLFKDNKEVKWKQIRNANKNSNFKRVYEEYGEASIDFIKLFSYDLYQFDIFKNYKKFMIIRPGIVVNADTNIDLFDSYYEDNDYTARFLNFRYSQRYRNASIQEFLKIIFQNLNLTIDSIFTNDNDSIWKQMFNYALKNTKLYNRAKTRIFNVQNTMKNDEMDLFNGILIDTHDSIFISNFEYFRSKEYELFFKNMFLAHSIYNDAMIPNDPITLFLSLMKRNDQDDNPFYRKDFEIISDVDIKYDISGDGMFNEFIHNNAGNVESYININNINFEFTLDDLFSEETLLPSKKREVATTSLNNTVEQEDSLLFSFKREDLKDIDLDNKYLIDQRFFSIFTFENQVKIFKKHEFIEMIKSQIFQKHQKEFTEEQVGKLVDLYIYDNIKKLYRIFNKEE